MRIVLPRAQKSVRRLLSGLALATVLAVSTGHAALGGTVDAAAANDTAATDRTDVYLKDITSDTGMEPHGTLYSSFFNSPDIAICPTPVFCSPSTNPIIGSTSYIVANLRNAGPYGSGIGAGTLKAYYTTSGGAANWPGDWTFIGSKTLTVPAGVTTTSIAWPNVPTLGHFCLLLRWESGTDPMVLEGNATSVNTQYNNNIVWKNANTVPAPGAGSVQVRPYALANMLPVPAAYDLAFRPLGEAVPGQRIVADLGPELFERWRRAGAPGEGVRVVGQNQVEVVDPYKAQIRGLLINPGERPVLKLSFAQNQALQRSYVLQVVQVGPVQKVGERFDVGGVDYTIVPGRG